jgi:hypothetical protein
VERIVNWPRIDVWVSHAIMEGFAAILDHIRNVHAQKWAKLNKYLFNWIFRDSLGKVANFDWMPAFREYAKMGELV